METMLFTSEQGRLLIESQAVYSRIKEKINDFKGYDFSSEQSCALNIFFDLAQEFDSTTKLYTLVVLIPHIFFGVDSQLFLSDVAAHKLHPGAKFKLELKASSIAHGGLSEEDIPKSLRHSAFWKGDFFCCPVIGRGCRDPEDGHGTDGLCDSEEALGLFVMRPKEKFAPHEELYFQKYANRVGVQIHHRVLASRNHAHIQFVKGLVNDIGHNVIVPNMYFKLLIQQLYGKIENISHLKHELKNEVIELDEFLLRLDALQYKLQENYTEIYRHFQQTSMFLESLLRQSHFNEGRYVLQQRKINLMQQVVLPQFDRYLSRMRDRGIMPCMPEPPKNVTADESVMVTVDVGLISQVLANLLSNAVKYTRKDNITHNSHVSCDVTLLKNHFGQGKDGVKVAVLSTGEHIAEEETAHLFEAQFRASNIKGEYGTGHGLHFVREMVMQHQGEVGYSAEKEGNSFYFILPCECVPNYLAQ